MAASDRLVYSHSISESFVHIINPVAVQALKAIIQRLGYLEYFSDKKGGSEIHIVSDFSSTSKVVDDNGNPKIVDNRIRAKLMPSINPSNNKWEGSGTTIALGNGNAIVSNPGGGNTSRRIPWDKNSMTTRDFAVFYDRYSHTDLTEMAVGSTLQLEVQAEFSHQVVATEFLARIFQCLTDGDMIGYVDIEYDYPVPMPIQQVLRHIYDLRGSHDQTDRSSYDWCHNNSKGAITLMVNRNKPDTKELVISRNNFQALYLVECSQDFPQPKSTGPGVTVNFNLTVQYARAERLVLRYPCIVNNKYVDFDFIPMDAEYRKGPPSPIMWSNMAVTRFWIENYGRKGHEAVHYPWWDKWQVPADSILTHRGFTQIAVIAFTLDDPDDETAETVIDLVNGLPGFHLSDGVINEIKVKRNTLLFPNDYINISVFADDAMLGMVAWTDGYKPLLDLSDGRHLHVRGHRKDAVYRLVVSYNPRPINMTSRPISYQVYPSRWLDVTSPTYVQTKDGICLDGVAYFYRNADNTAYIPIPADVAYPGRPTNDLRALYNVGVLFNQEPPMVDASMRPKYEPIAIDDESSIEIIEKKIGTPSGQVYCYAQPNTGSDEPQMVYIDLKSVVILIREAHPEIGKIYLSDVRTQIGLPNTIIIQEELAPAITEPVQSIAPTLKSYIDSSRGRNVNHVWKVGLVTYRDAVHKQIRHRR